MFRNYFRVAWRSLAKNKISSFINVFGLAIGMAVAMLNGLWIWDELSYNKYYQHYDRIGQVMASEEHDGQRGTNTSLSYPLAMELKTNYQSQFKYLVRSDWPQTCILSAGEKKLSSLGQFMDEQAPDMLTLKMLYGSRSGLHDPHSILLSESIARAMFGNTDPVNRAIRVNNQMDVTVTGVYEDMPLNTQFNSVKFIAPFDLWVSENAWVAKRAIDDWSNHFIRVFAEINPTSSFEQVNAAIKNAERQHESGFRKGFFHNPQDFIEPMSRWHLYAYKNWGRDDAALRMVRLVGIIGGIVLLLACINFMNLSTARSEKRAKEVGIRKTIGSARWQLINQFFSESLLVALFAFVLAVLLVVCSLSWFNSLAAKEMSMPWASPYFWLVSLAFILITGLVAGSYPALYLSSFKPVKVLKGTFRAGRFAAMPRKALVVLQFSISVILVICTVVVYRQIQYAKDRPVGYSRDGLLMMRMGSPDFFGKYELLRTELKNTGAVAEMSESMGPVTTLWSNNNGFSWKGMDPNMKQNFGTLAVTSEHGKTVGWQFVQGRNFSAENVADSSGIVMNETAVKYMGLQNPVGETVGWKFWNSDTTHYYTVLGVIKDMVMESPYDPVKPTLFFIKSLNGSVSWINIKIAPGVSTSYALGKIEHVFKQLIPSAPFEYKFADEEYAHKFAAEEHIGKLAAFFGILAVVISCLGLFGLASFVAEQRTREIGIRKVLGASVFNVWRLLSKEFALLVVISCAVAIPLAWYFMQQWVQGYSYRAPIAWWIFATAAAGALIITLFTVSLQSIKAALANPVNSLKAE
jgi:predicted permease